MTLVAPGLNLKPLAMMEMIKLLNDSGSDACLLSFSGVLPPQYGPSAWPEEFIKTYSIARSLADQQMLPLYFLGYSLGALLGDYLISIGQENIRVDKQILIAPATAIRLPHLLKSSVSLLNGRLKIPSYTPKEYRLNNWLPVKVYQLMLEWEKGIKKARFAHLNIPTLLIVDPRDELINYTAIRKQISQYELSNYQCVVLETSLKGRSTKYHHLVISEATMGKKNWEEVRKRIIEFLSFN